jgi:hypothetical protein
VKHFCNTRNTIPYIQDIEIINAFHDRVSDIKTVEEITMKNPKTVVDLLAVADICIEASKAWARLQGRWMIVRSTQLTEAVTRTKEIVDTTASSPQIRRRKGLSDVPMTRRSGARFTIPWGMIWKSVRLFWIRRRCHQRVDQHRVDSDGDEQMREINIIFGGSMSIASKTQGKKLQREISLAQRIESGRTIRWSDTDISFGPEDHPDTGPFGQELALDGAEIA